MYSKSSKKDPEAGSPFKELVAAEMRNEVGSKPKASTGTGTAERPLVLARDLAGRMRAAEGGAKASAGNIAAADAATSSVARDRIAT